MTNQSLLKFGAMDPVNNPSLFKNIIGIRVSMINMENALRQIGNWISNRDQHYVCAAATHLITEGSRNPRLKRVLNQAGMVTPDGMPLVWLARLAGHSHVRRVYGPDLMLAVCARSLETGWSHYFYGGAPGVVDELKDRLSTRFPGIKISGFCSPPFRPLSNEEDMADVSQINESGADILWVGLGAPKQEFWLAEHVGKIKAPVMISVGAAFDFHAGIKPQAPKWMQRSGLEWLFRLISEPRRLWKRYLINNSLFIGLCALQLLGLKKFDVE